jgi:hypothetical protein
MRFEVPQFIDVEDKIFGPLTFKQFIYLAGGAGLAYVGYKIAPLPINFILIVVFAGLGLLLAFYKLNNRTFIELAQAYLSYQIKGKLYIWKRDAATSTKERAKIPEPPKPPAPKRFDEKTITDLAQNLDILDH